MSPLKNIIEVTEADFTELVIEKSSDIPVLVDFWADWCGPCKMQMPVLEKLAEELQGNFLVAKINTDVERSLAAKHGIRSLPTMRLYRHGEVVEEVLGAQSEATLRALIEPHMDRESDQALQSALDAMNSGDPDSALATLKTGYETDPDNHRLAMEYAQLCIQAGQLATASDVLDELPLDERETPRAKGLYTLLQFSQAAASAPDANDLQQALDADPDNPELRYQLAAQQTLNKKYDDALENLIELLKRNRNYADNAAQRGLLGIFDLLGSDDERVTQYRRKMFALLH